MKGRSFQGEQYDKRFLTICQVKGSQKKVKRNVGRAAAAVPQTGVKVGETGWIPRAGPP